MTSLPGLLPKNVVKTAVYGMNQRVAVFEVVNRCEQVFPGSCLLCLTLPPAFFSYTDTSVIARRKARLARAFFSPWRAENSTRIVLKAKC